MVGIVTHIARLDLVASLVAGNIGRKKRALVVAIRDVCECFDTGDLDGKGTNALLATEQRYTGKF